MAEKKYYWLKLPEDFFRNKHIKKLRKIAGGDTYTIIYLKMLLSSMKTEGRLFYEGYEDSVSDEIALEIDEDEENVSIAFQYLVKAGLVEVQEDEIVLQELPKMVGSEGGSARRMRKLREKTSQCDSKLLQSDDDVTNGLNNVQICYTEKEIEKSKRRDREEIEKSKRREETVSKDTVCRTETVQRVVDYWNDLETFGIKPIKRVGQGTKRHDALNARLKQYGLDEILNAIDMIKQSDFLQGKNNKGWVITFDWFILPNNFIKVLEGNYDNREKQSTGSAYVDSIKNRIDEVDTWV